ncbi:adenylate kinase 9 [Sorex fumeus]|uniref:adenylate kinase 9 n=1 Tax=Sorex fumeus TaxID=62283 RepID=UPI0024AE45BE|nr:adenylate kinase 9 [Sorex fumeus]
MTVNKMKEEQHPFVDIFDEDETEKNFMLSKPVCFVVFGKPGVGKTTLANYITQTWKCIPVEALPVLEELIASDTPSGNLLQSMLHKGHSIPDEVIIKLLLEKLNSQQVSHFGYIITEIPSLSEDTLTIRQQIDFIKNLNLKPDIIINIKCPDHDLCNRTSGQRQHSMTGHLYIRDQWDLDAIGKRRKKRKGTLKETKAEEEGEEEEEQEEEEALLAGIQLVAGIIQHLVQRPEDYMENIEQAVKLYKDTILPSLEEMMAEHNSQYLIELDGNRTPEELFMVIMDRLKYLNLRRAGVLAKLQSSEEEMNYTLETEEMLRSLASYKLIAPRYRWQRSKWARMCPVSLKEGNIQAGLPDYSVSFLGKMYCLSSEETLKTFLLNPRPYLLPPMPKPPVKLFLFGPPSSGKTTLSNLLAEHYNRPVIDYNQLVMPRFEKAREMLIKNMISEATERAIAHVKERLIAQLHTDGKVSNDQSKRGSVENEDKKTSEKNPDQAGISQNVLVKDEETNEPTPEEHSLGMNQKANTETTLDLIEEVTADHPEVVSMIAGSVQMVQNANFEQPNEKYAEILAEILKEVEEENMIRYPDASKYGGWILDNCPVLKELWVFLVEKGVIPDLVIVLSNMENNGQCVLNRLYLQNKSEIDSSIIERLTQEMLLKKKEEEEAKKADEALRIQENKKDSELMKKPKRKNIDLDEIETEEAYAENEFEPKLSRNPVTTEEVKGAPEESEPTDNAEITNESVKHNAHNIYFFSELTEDTTAEAEIPKGSKEDLETEDLNVAVSLPEFPADAYPEVPEMEPFKEKVKYFNNYWKFIEAVILENTQLLNLEITDKTSEELLQKVVDTIERPFQYSGWELNVEDFEEETEDYQAEAEVEEDEGEEEEEEEESEEKAKEKKRHLGDSKHFCPVALKEYFILQPGNTDDAVKYREKIYYMSSIEAKEKFLEHPEDYVAHKEPLKAPPLRICLLGPHGSGKTVCGRKLAEKFGIFHIQFEEFLQEKLMLKTEKRAGPEFEEESDDEQAFKQEFEELAAQAHVAIKISNTKKPKPVDVELTEEEEAIKANLMENDPLPSEILEKFLSEWWFQEPIRSTGFILDGFPRNPEEAQILGEHGFFPDAAVFLQVEDQDISDRLLPELINKWKMKQKKKLERKNLIKEMKTKIRNDMISKRRAELLAEREKKRKEELGRDDDETTEEEPDDDDDIDNILEDEFPKDEEDLNEEEEEQEADAIDRLRTEIGEKFELDMGNMQTIQEEFEKLLIPVIPINGSRKIHIVEYTLNTKLKPLVENRASIFEKCYPISPALAQKMINFTYKHISSFGYWDPVKLSEGDTIKPVERLENPLYPVIHRQYIYFLSNKKNKEKFMKNPIKYIRQPEPKPTMPIRIAIVGPPKSGKTTVARAFAKEYGLKSLSMGDALRYIIHHQPETELALVIKWHLYKGETVPDELAIQALEVCLMESICNTAGVVIDGYPVTKHQVNILEARSIIPMVIFELEVPLKEIFKRLVLLKKKEPSNLPYPLHNSAHITAVKDAKYHKNIPDIKQFYEEQHQNWRVIDGFHSKWWVWNEVMKATQTMNKYIQTYLGRIKEGKAALIDKLCISPQELISRLGEFEQFCPVSLAELGELVDCSLTDSLKFAAEFRGHYYKMSSRENLNKFLENPELYVPPLAPHPLPPADMIPKQLTLSELKKRFPKCAELQGYCPVTYRDGEQRYEALVPGNVNYAVEYRDRIYICETKEKLQKFLRLPEKYWDQTLPNKLPPLKEPISLTSLPLPGYLEQGTASSLIKALNAAGCLKPKYPFLSVKRSVLLYIALHLKAFNPKGSEYSRKTYKKKMEQFVERCELITYLNSKMTKNYKEPEFRPIDFDFKLETFMSLRNRDPINDIA